MKSIAALLIVVFFSTPALAGMKFLPMWEQRKCPTDTYACYNFRQAKDLEKLDLDLQFQAEERNAYILTNQELGKAIEDLKAAGTLTQQNVTNLEKRLAEKQDVLEKTTATVVKLERRNILGGALPWMVAIVAVTFAGAFVGGWYVGAK